MKQETLEEVAERILSKNEVYDEEFLSSTFLNTIKSMVEMAKWQQEISQQIVPFDAKNIEVFAIKPDESGKLFAYIGYKITNGNFHFNVVPFTEPQYKNKYSEEEVLPLLEILQKCKEYFLLKTDKYSDERADAIIDVLENFKNK